MTEANGQGVDMNRRNFLKKSGPALAAAGVAAHLAAGSALGQERGGALPGQTPLNRLMLKADSALSRIGKGISGGMMDEVAAGAKELSATLQRIGEADIGKIHQQGEWHRRSLDAASNAEMMYELAEAAITRGEKEISPEIVELYSVAVRLTASCHSAFRVSL